ncbi:MAG: hypothetical protein CL678_01020 [Bdellovibrionaceae bacterium]|nr:hypothetical protein [Pseudobdellovibrionaceae bacterium]|tara:strand:- start:37 stop:576 length:540 start_codon:yes stop_codon:yes gene_type:complete
MSELKDRKKEENYIRGEIARAGCSARAKINADLFLASSQLRVIDVDVSVKIKWTDESSSALLCPGFGKCTGSCDLCMHFSAYEAAKARNRNKASRTRKAGKGNASCRRKQGGRQQPIEDRFKTCVAYSLFRDRSNERSRASKERNRKAKQPQPPPLFRTAVSPETEDDDEEERLVIVHD